MSEGQTRIIFDEKIIEKYKRKREGAKKIRGLLLPILVTVLFIAAVLSVTLIRTKFSYLFTNEQNVLYVKNNAILLRDLKGEQPITIDTDFKSDSNTNIYSKALKGLSVYDKKNKQLFYIKGLYKPSYEKTGQLKNVGTLKVINLGNNEIETLESDVLADSLYFNEKNQFILFTQLTTERGLIKLSKIDLKNKNEIVEIASSVHSYYVYRESGKVVYYDSNKRLCIYDGETNVIDTNIQSLSFDTFKSKTEIHTLRYNNEKLANKIYWTKDCDLGTLNSYDLYEYDILTKEVKLLVSNVSNYVNILGDGSMYYTRDFWTFVPYLEYIDVNSNVNSLKAPSAMTRQKLEGIDFIVYKNNIYDSSDTEKVEEVMSKYNVEFEEYERKVSRYNSFLNEIPEGFYPLLNRSIYYYDGYHEYKLNDKDVIGEVGLFDGGVFFRISKGFPIIKLKLSDVVEMKDDLNTIITNLINSQKSCYYIYKELNGLSIPALNFIKNEEASFYYDDKEGDVILGYSHYVGDKIYNNLVEVKSMLNSFDVYGANDKYERVGTIKNRTSNVYDIIKYIKTINSDQSNTATANKDEKKDNINYTLPLYNFEIGKDSERQNAILNIDVVLTNNENNNNSLVYPFYINYDAQNMVGTLYLYSGKTGKSIKLGDNVQAAIVMGENEGLYLNQSKSGKSDLRFNNNIIDEDVSYIIDMYGNDAYENKIKPAEVKKGKKQNEEVEEEVEIDYSKIATRSYLLAGRDFAEAEAYEAELPVMQMVGFETVDNIKMYNKGNMNYARNEWVDVGAFRYHFDGKGEMEVSKWIDNLYYVNHVGVMVKNSRTPDGYRVDANGEFIDDEELQKQAKRLAESTTKKAQAEKKNNTSSSSGNTTSTSNYSQSQPVINKSQSINTNATEIESANRKFYVSGYQNMQFSITGDESDCDVTINYPIISGEDSAEVQKVNDAITDILDQIEVEVEGQVEQESSTVTKYVINKAKISNIAKSKITINLTGTMARSNGNKGVKLTIVYYRDSGTAEIS